MLCRWIVKINGDAWAIRRVSQALSESLQFSNENGSTYISSEDWRGLSCPSEVHCRALDVLKWINLVMHLERADAEDITLGALIRREDHKIDTQYIFAEAIAEGSSFGIAEVHVLGEEKGSAAHKPAWILAYEAMADGEREVKEALEWYREGTWGSLYKVSEVLESRDDGAQVIRKLELKERVRRFCHTANHYEGAGPDARHARTKTIAPKNPMNLTDAKELWGQILREWLREKRYSNRESGSHFA